MMTKPVISIVIILFQMPYYHRWHGELDNQTQLVSLRESLRYIQRYIGDILNGKYIVLYWNILLNNSSTS